MDVLGIGDRLGIRDYNINLYLQRNVKILIKYNFELEGTELYLTGRNKLKCFEIWRKLLVPYPESFNNYFHK